MGLLRGQNPENEDQEESEAGRKPNEDDQDLATQKVLVTVGKFKFHRVTGPVVKWQWVKKQIGDGNGVPYTKVEIKGESGQLLDPVQVYLCLGRVVFEYICLITFSPWVAAPYS